VSERLFMVCLYALLCATVAFAVAALQGCGSASHAVVVVRGPDDELRELVEVCDHTPAHVTLREHTPVRVRGMTVWCAR